MGRDGRHGRYRVAIIATTLLVILAGCSTVLPGSESAAYTTSGDDLNGSTLSQDHVSQLEEAGSYTTLMTLDVESVNQSASIESTTRVDLDPERALRTSIITADLFGGAELRTDTFTANDETYRRLEFDQGDQPSVQYSHATAPYQDQGELGTTPVNFTETMNARLARSAGDSIQWTQTGTVERNGTTLTRYEASGQESFADFRNQTVIGPSDGNLTDLNASVSEISAVMFVNRNGLVREFSFELNGTRDGGPVSLSFAVEIVDVSATTVEDPDWLEEARQQT